MNNVGVISRTSLAATFLLAGGLLAVFGGAGVLSGTVAFVILALVPGAAFAVCIDRRATTIETAFAGLAFSPVINTAIASLAILAGASPEVCARVVLVAAATAGAVALTISSPARSSESRREVFLLVVIIGGFAVLIGVLPQVVEWWRIRSDAWFHAAVIAEIRDFGLPPSDPYFAGIPLQYMWAYHVNVLTLSTASGLDVFRTMALVNLQAFAGFVVATFLFARSLGADFRRAAGSAAVVPLAMSALFWAFLPIRLARAFTGEVRGMEEVSRQLSLSPFTYEKVRHFTSVWFNSEFFLDKFMVATAFSIALCLMAACWYAAADYMRNRRRFSLAAVVVAVTGMLAFHPPVGLVMLTALIGAPIVLAIAARRFDRSPLRPALYLLGAGVAAAVLSSVYLYNVMSAKDSGGGLPIGISLDKIVGVVISVALVLWLFLRQRRFLAGRDNQTAFLLCAIAVITLFSLLLKLPGNNTFDKPAYFIYFPLAVIGAWTIVDFLGDGKRAIRWIVVIAALAPINVLSLAACYLMKPPVEVTVEEALLSRWVREHTGRTDVFIDEDSRVSLLVTGPRRYYFGRESYAEQWGYDRVEMARRRDIRDALYGDTEMLESETAEALAELGTDIFMVERRPPGTPPPPPRFAEYFEPVYTGDEIRLYRFNR